MSAAADVKTNASHNGKAARLVLEDGYYHQHMQELLHYVQQVQAPLWPDACDATIQRYLGVSQDAQRLWLRLVQRKGPCFMLAQLDYADIGNIHEAWQQLLAVGLLQALSVHRVADYLAQATKPQLQQLWSVLADHVLAAHRLPDHEPAAFLPATSLPAYPKAQAPRAAFYTPLLQLWQRCYAHEYQRVPCMDADYPTPDVARLAIDASGADRSIPRSVCARWLAAIQALHRVPAIARDDATHRDEISTLDLDNDQRADNLCWVATVEGRDSLDYLYFLYFGALSAQDRDGKPSATPFTLRDLGIRQVRTSSGSDNDVGAIRQNAGSQAQAQFRRRFEDSVTARRAFAWAQVRQQMFVAAKAWQARWRALTMPSDRRRDDVASSAEAASVNAATTATKQAKIQLALQLWPELLGWWQHVQQLAPALEARSERHAQQLWYGLGRWAERCYSELLSDVSTVEEDPVSELHVSAKHVSDASCSALNGAEPCLSAPGVSAPSLSDISCSENSCLEKSGSANSSGATEAAAVTDTPAPQPKPDAEHFAALALACYQAAPQWPASERLVRLYDKWRQWPDIVAAESAPLPPSATHFGPYPPQKIPRGALAQQLMQQLLERMMQSPDGDTELIFAHDFWDRRLAARCGARHSVLTAMLRQAPCIVLDEVYRQRVEDGVLRYVQPLGYQGFFAENMLWRALFTLVLWPVLYHQGEMHNDFELRPRSLMQPGFYQRHQAAIEAELAVLQPLTPDGLAMLLQRYQQIVLCQTDLVRWPAQFSAILVLLWYGRWQTSALALQGLSPQPSMSSEPSMSTEPSALSPPMSSEPMPTHGQASALQTPDVTAPPPVVVSEMGAVLATVIRRMAQDFPRNSQGFPDLLLYKALNDVQSISTDCLAMSGTAVPLAMLFAQVNKDQTNTAGVDLEQLTAIAAAYPAWVAHIGGSQAPVSAAFELQLVEVKASGDQLRAAQLARLQWFLQLDVAAAVLRVEWGADPQRLYAVVDVETTGGKSEQDRITEIAVVQVRAGKIVGSWSSLVNPERKIPRYIQRLTGISDAMVANAPTFSQVWPEIASYFADAVFVAHNVNFDYGFVRAEAQRAGQTLMMPRLCTVVQSRRCWPELSGYGLAALAEQLDLPLTQHHRAHADAWATAHLLLKLQAAGGGTELQTGLSSEL